MKALCWEGVNRLSVRQVPDPELSGGQDVLLKVTASSVCGSDLHLLDGYVPAMRSGDVLGHEFIGEVMEIGADVKRHKVGDRVVVASPLGCGRCTFCEDGLWSLCDNSNPTPAFEEALYGHAGAGIFGYSHAFGGFPGSHAEYIRVPYADHGAFTVPEGLTDEQALFVSDAVPTGWMAADQADIPKGGSVAVWGAGGVGQMAARAAQLLGAELVVVIDRCTDRLRSVEQHVPGVRTLDLRVVDVVDELRDLTGGRGPDACIEAVGMEARDVGVSEAYDRVKQTLRMETDRAGALRQAIRACGKGGTVSVAGVFGGVVDKFPMGAVMNKGLTLRSGQQHGQKYIPMLLERITAGDLDPAYLVTHPMSLDEGPEGYQTFKHKKDGCLRAVFYPAGQSNGH
jgi:threonine dehydrogenase-like Zn-dependent dehydrogenase